MEFKEIVLVDAHERIYYWKDLRVDGRMLLKWSVKK